MKMVLVTMIGLMCLFVFPACEKKSAMEEVGEEIHEGAEETGEAMKEAGEAAGEEMEDATDGHGH